MYVVFWIKGRDDEAAPNARAFPGDQMGGALTFMETLRAGQRNGEPISFVTMASENPDSVGLAGVAETGPDYNWKKRRR